MSETKWTPGPWSQHYDDNGFFYVHAERAPSPYVVATGNEGDVDRANARLIAAAPDLAEAAASVKAFTDLSMADDMFDDEQELGVLMTMRTIRAFRAALSKAQGDQ